MKKFSPAIRRNLRKYSDNCAIIVALVIAPIVFYYFGEKPEVPVAILAAGISISFNSRQYRIENDKMFKELFLLFNDKYDKKFNDKLNKIDRKTHINTEYQLTKKDSELIVDYLNLCAEEYLWYRKGRIDHLTWSSWESGMKYYLNIRSISKQIEIEKTQKDSYYGLFEKLEI